MAIKTLHLTNAWHECSGGIATFYRALLDAGNRHKRPVRLVVPGPLDRVEEVGAFGRIYFVAAPKAPLRMFVTNTLGNPEDDEGWIPGILAPIAKSRKDATQDQARRANNRCHRQSAVQSESKRTRRLDRRPNQES